MLWVLYSREAGAPSLHTRRPRRRWPRRLRCTKRQKETHSLWRIPCTGLHRNRRKGRGHGALCAIQHLGVVGEPGGSGRGECVRVRLVIGLLIAVRVRGIAVLRERGKTIVFIWINWIVVLEVRSSRITQYCHYQYRMACIAKQDGWGETLDCAIVWAMKGWSGGPKQGGCLRIILVQRRRTKRRIYVRTAFTPQHARLFLNRVFWGAFKASPSGLSVPKRPWVR